MTMVTKEENEVRRIDNITVLQMVTFFIHFSGWITLPWWVLWFPLGGSAVMAILLGMGIGLLQAVERSI